MNILKSLLLTDTYITQKIQKESKRQILRLPLNLTPLL